MKKASKSSPGDKGKATISFQGHSLWQVIDNPGHHAKLASLLVRNLSLSLISPLRIREMGGYTGLDLGALAQIDLELKVDECEVVSAMLANPGVAEFFDETGALIAIVPFQRTGNIGRASLSAPGIKRIVIQSPEEQAVCLMLHVHFSGADRSPHIFSDAKIRIFDTLDKDTCAEVVFGETATLRAPNGNEDQLAAGRTFIAAVAYNRYLANPGNFAPRKHPTADQLADPSIKKHWNLCNASAVAGQAIDIGKCRHFVIWPINKAGTGPINPPKIPDDTWPYNDIAKITTRYGPFTSYSPPTGDTTYIFRYCGVA
jgi:hypothetical protein